MWRLLLLFLIVMVVYLVYKRQYEPMVAKSSYELVQEQVGKIQQIHDKLSKVTITEASLDVLQHENDQTTDQINQLRSNLPSSTVIDAYPGDIIT